MPRSPGGEHHGRPPKHTGPDRRSGPSGCAGYTCGSSSAPTSGAWPVRRLAGRPGKKPDSVAADRGYSNGPCRQYLRKRDIRHVIPEKAGSRAARLRKGARGRRPPGFDGQARLRPSRHDHRSLTRHLTARPTSTGRVHPHRDALTVDSHAERRLLRLLLGHDREHLAGRIQWSVPQGSTQRQSKPSVSLLTLVFDTPGP
ncbi:transposase [Streptomyces sp. NPDC001652]|uniref:transposase n=1 Tax=Streptomyces sp. NPDC001652 TaxID=3154393 RepID=UPI003327C2EB